MKCKNIFLVISVSIFSVFKVVAQTQFSGWLASFNTIKVSGKFSIHLDVQVRSTDQVKDLSTLLFRPGINWQVRKNMIATAGYGYISNRSSINNVNGYLPEHRIWEQFIISHPISFATTQHRLRLEQRFLSKGVIKNNELKAEGNLFANRIRYFTRSIIPLSGGKGFKKGLFGAVQNEIFLNLGDKAPVNGKIFDQNRFYLAAGYRFSRKFDIEAGYMNQYVAGRNNAIRNNHIAQTALYIRL